MLSHSAAVNFMSLGGTSSLSALRKGVSTVQGPHHPWYTSTTNTTQNKRQVDRNNAPQTPCFNTLYRNESQKYKTDGCKNIFFCPKRGHVRNFFRALNSSLGSSRSSKESALSFRCSETYEDLQTTPSKFITANHSSSVFTTS